MYRRPKFLEELLEIREQMSRDSYYDVDLFAERIRSGKRGRKRAKLVKISDTAPVVRKIKGRH